MKLVSSYKFARLDGFVDVPLSPQAHEMLVGMGMPAIVPGDKLSAIRAGQWLAANLPDLIAMRGSRP